MCQIIAFDELISCSSPTKSQSVSIITYVYSGIILTSEISGINNVRYIFDCVFEDQILSASNIANQISVVASAILEEDTTMKMATK